jgi:glycosyltransferase involved in cell wall biosynthesis
MYGDSSSIFQGKRILHLIGDSEFGGDTIYLFALANRMREFGGQVYIGTTTLETIARATRDGFPVLQVPALRRPIHPVRDLLSVLSVFALCRRHRFDLVHTHTSKPGAVGRLAARLAGVPCVVHTIHGFAFHDRSSFLERVLYTNIERAAGLFCDAAISVNREDRATAVRSRILRPNKVVTILNGVDPARFHTPFDRDAFRRSLGVREGEILVGCVARMAPQKDPQRFLEAAKLVAEARPNVRCLFLGGGPLFPAMQEFAAGLGLDGRLLLPGFQRNVEDYLRALDVFVLNSLWEGLPIALLEAMCVGLPIVATDIKGNRECVDPSSAALVPPGSAPALAEAVLRLVDNPDLAAGLARQARLRFQAEFTQERMLEQTFSLYERLLLARARQPCPSFHMPPG